MKFPPRQHDANLLISSSACRCFLYFFNLQLLLVTFVTQDTHNQTEWWNPWTLYARFQSWNLSDPAEVQGYVHDFMQENTKMKHFHTKDHTFQVFYYQGFIHVIRFYLDTHQKCWNIPLAWWHSSFTSQQEGPRFVFSWCLCVFIL